MFLFQLLFAHLLAYKWTFTVDWLLDQMKCNIWHFSLHFLPWLLRLHSPPELGQHVCRGRYEDGCIAAFLCRVPVSEGGLQTNCPQDCNEGRWLSLVKADLIVWRHKLQGPSISLHTFFSSLDRACAERPSAPGLRSSEEANFWQERAEGWCRWKASVPRDNAGQLWLHLENWVQQELCWAKW